MNKKHILVPIDFTKESEYGVQTALGVAKKISAKVTLLHIIEDEVQSDFNPSADLEAKAAIAGERQHFVMELVRKQSERLKILELEYQSEGVEATSLVLMSQFDEGMENLLKGNSIDLVIMGSSGETSISQYFKGNRTNQTIDIAHVPVLSVKEYKSVDRLSRILLMVDPENYQKEALKMLADFAELMEMEIYLGHKDQSKEHAEFAVRQKLVEIAKEINIDTDAVYVMNKDNSDEDLDYFILSRQIDVIATHNEHASGISKIIFGDDTEKLVNESPIPTLTVG